MNQLPHIEFATLADFVEDRLDASARADVQAHLSACADCAGQAAQLGEVTGLMRGDAMEDAPRYARIAATNLFRARRQTAKQPVESSLRRVLAALKFDSLGMTPAFGIRSASATERQLLFTAYDNELHLQIAPAAERWQITGQVLGPCAGGAVELRGADETLSVTLNELCEFTLAPVVAGTYALRLRLGDVEMEIPELLVGESKG
jgi:anti-sigma factor RsiW